jgi:hypothetical protein
MSTTMSTASYLPVIIDTTGIYITRDGSSVEIDEFDEFPDLSVMAFKCKGYIRIIREGKSDKFKYGIWHRSGMYSAVSGHNLDIISKG